MKRWVVLLGVCSVCYNCLAQNKISESAYKNKSVKITTYHGGKLIGSGSAFVIKQDDGYFLVTNYHLLTNLKAQDTAEFDAPAHRVSPTSMAVSFNNMPAKTYPLIKNKARIFYSPAAGSSKTTTDLAFYKLKDIPHSVKLDTVDLHQTSNEYAIDKPSKLFIYGAGQLAKIDYETTLSLFGQITGKETHPLSGVSGAPVFGITGGNKSFVGMAAFTKKNADGTKSFVIITKGSIRSSFSALSPK